jgi:hypothetical protein
VPLVQGNYRTGVGCDIAGANVDWIYGGARANVTESDLYGVGDIRTRGTFLLHNRWIFERQVAEIDA